MRYQKLVSVAATLGAATALTAALGTTPANATTCYWIYASGVDGDRGRVYYCYSETSPGRYTAWGEHILVNDTTPNSANAIIRATGNGFSPLVIARDAYGGEGSTGSFRKTNTANVKFHVCGELSGPIVVDCVRMTRNG